MQKLFFFFIVVILLFSACNKDNVGSSDDDYCFVIDKMQWLRVSPSVDEDFSEFRWLLDDNVIANTKDLIHVFLNEGSYTLIFESKNELVETVQTFSVKVNDKTYINGITRVFDYSPAPGQFINQLPAATVDDTHESMREKAQEALTAGYVISLGGFGGYVIFGFDHVVVNRQGNDFVVLGNAFMNTAEPGVIMVSFDANDNGLPDDEWYEIAGSEFFKSTTIKNYEITYHRPEIEPAEPSEDNYIFWTDNQGQTGFIPKNAFHSQSYYPHWRGDSFTLKGTLMEANLTDISGSGTHWVNAPYDWGYADNYSNNDPRGQIDIEWAVDKNGKSVELKGIDFIKVYTGNSAQAGWMGELSTEVSGFRNLNL